MLANSGIESFVWFLSNASIPATPDPTLGQSLLNILPEWLTAAGTIGATLVALGYLRRKPHLGIELQQQVPTLDAYWHATSGIFLGIETKQLRVWVRNDGGREARNCRVKMTITEARLRGGDAPVEFLLPVTQLYTPRVVIEPLATLVGIGHLAPPNEGEVTITISPHSQEAFDLLYHNDRVSEPINPYSKVTFPLQPNVEYVLNLTAYADEIKPSKPVRFRLFWDGTEQALGRAISTMN